MIDTLALTYCNVANVSYEDGLKLAAFERQYKADFEIWYKTHPIKPAKMSMDDKKPRGTAVKVTCTDHLGNVYKCKADMCKAYGIKLETFRKRINLGWSLKDALTVEKINDTDWMVKDHLGNKFRSLNEMFRHWSVSSGCFWARMKKGLSLKDCLAPALKKEDVHAKKIKDHLGVEWPSVKAMCKAYNLSATLFNERKNSGMSLEEALTTPLNLKYRKHEYVDHLGKHYKNQTAMCMAWDVPPTTYKTRIKNGWTVKLALTLPTNIRLSLQQIKNLSKKEEFKCK